MQYNPLALSVATAISLAISANAVAADQKLVSMPSGMEKCNVVKNGKGMIKAHKGDCQSSKNSCAGQNPAGDTEAWIFVPKGQCAKIINDDDCSGISTANRERLEDGVCK